MTTVKMYAHVGRIKKKSSNDFHSLSILWRWYAKVNYPNRKIIQHIDLKCI